MSLFAKTRPAPPPPASDCDALLWLRLIRSRRVGPATFFRLMGEFGTAKAALDALPGVARAAGATDYTVCAIQDAEQEYEAGHRVGARLICLGTDDYPALLAQISDPPPVLWLRGNASLLNRPAVALVGARNASSLGTRMARLLAGELGKNGYVVASGLARGIDTAAHIAALDTGTIAVLAGGIDRVYPAENADLAVKIVTNGAIISEQPVGMTAQARHFPRRNRIVSGLCQAVVVVEGAAKSGSLITAREALDQGRDVMAVPGHPLDARASGCNMLIRDGATLVRGGNDIIAALSRPPVTGPILPTPSPPPKATVSEALDISRKILSLLSPAPISEDQLIRELNLPAQSVSPQLVNLELEGKLERQSGGMVLLAV